MEDIPPALMKSLNVLGLSNNEASVYAALILYDNAEAKEIIDYLSLSKPSVYEALDHLAEMGLAVKRVTKPARYSAISPEMAIDLLMDKHRKAGDQALGALRTLEKKKVHTDKEDALWTIYGDANIEYKIRDLFGRAKRHISCMIGERYLPFIENIKIKTVSLRLIVISDDSTLQGKLQELFPGKNADVHVISQAQFSVPPPFAPPEFIEITKFMNFENTLELIVDDEELLMIPPFISHSVSVLNTRNKGAILQMKMLSQLNWNRFIDGEELPFPVKPAQKKKRS
ncbi:MAG: helix-turn-helix domain-containing protein [Methanoregula sp.]|nr:helix-turn-helix domain-containing protein [Methanoregula sp.]